MSHSRQAFLWLAVVGAIGGTRQLAHAQDAAQTQVTAQAPAPGPSEDSAMWFGGHLGLSPVGNFHSEAAGVKMNEDPAAALELGVTFEYRLLPPYISVGIAPAALFNVKGTSDIRAGTEVDLPLRISAGLPLSDTIRAYAFGAPGYSILFAPANDSGNATHPHGFMVGFGGGVGYRASQRMELTFEGGYQFRFLTTSIDGVDVKLKPNFATFSVGLATALD